MDILKTDIHRHGPKHQVGFHGAAPHSIDFPSTNTECQNTTFLGQRTANEEEVITELPDPLAAAAGDSVLFEAPAGYEVARTVRVGERTRVIIFDKGLCNMFSFEDGPIQLPLAELIIKMRTSDIDASAHRKVPELQKHVDNATHEAMAIFGSQKDRLEEDWILETPGEFAREYIFLVLAKSLKEVKVCYKNSGVNCQWMESRVFDFITLQKSTTGIKIGLSGDSETRFIDIGWADTRDFPRTGLNFDMAPYLTLREWFCGHKSCLRQTRWDGLTRGLLVEPNEDYQQHVWGSCTYVVVHRKTFLTTLNDSSLPQSPWTTCAANILILGDLLTRLYQCCTREAVDWKVWDDLRNLITTDIRAITKCLRRNRFPLTFHSYLYFLRWLDHLSAIARVRMTGNNDLNSAEPLLDLTLISVVPSLTGVTLGFSGKDNITHERFTPWEEAESPNSMGVFFYNPTFPDLEGWFGVMSMPLHLGVVDPELLITEGLDAAAADIGGYEGSSGRPAKIEAAEKNVAAKEIGTAEEDVAAKENMTAEEHVAAARGVAAEELVAAEESRTVAESMAQDDQAWEMI